MAVKVIKDIRQARRNNKAQILWYLYNNGPMSRIELAKLLKLTTPSITQLISDLMIQQEVVEVGTIQRNASGRREVLLDLNADKNIALGINIETDVTYFCVANVRKVLKVYEFKTSIFAFQNTMDIFAQKVGEILAEFPQVNEICVGLNAKVDNGIVSISYDDIVENFNMKAYLEELFKRKTEIINNVKAQALSLYRKNIENYLYVTHSPEVGSAVIVKGEIVEEKDCVRGGLGHIVVDLDGPLCKCGKYGCLNTLVSDEAIEKQYFNKTGINKTVNEIYALYGTCEIATEMLNEIIKTLAVVIANTTELFNPTRVFVAGGIFCVDSIYDKGKEILDKCGFALDVERIKNVKELKSTAEARYIIIKSIFGMSN